MSENTKTESQIRSEEAEKLKKEGNTALSERNYSAAIDFYTKAIALTPDNHLLYSNRAAAFLSSDGGKEAAESAYADSCKCSEICPSFPKGYYRGAMALLKLERPLDAAKLLAGALSDSKRGISKVMDRREMCDFMTQCYVEHVKMNTSAETVKTDLDRSIEFLNGYVPPQDNVELPPSTAKTDMERSDAQTLAVVDFLCTHEDFCIAVANVVNAASKNEKESIDNEVITKIAGVSLSMTRGSRLVTLAYGAFYGLLPALVTYAQSTDSLDVLTSLIVSMSNTSSKFDENKRRLGRAGIVDAIKHIFDLPNDVHSKLFQAIFGSDSTSETALTQEERETHLKDLRSCIEAVSDLVCQDESLCRDLSNLGLVSTLMQLVENAPALRAVSVSAIGSLCSNETSCAEFIADDGVDKLYKLLISPESDAEVQKEVISTLRIVAAASKLGATAVISNKDLIDTLFTRMTYGSDTKTKSEASETAASDAKGKDSGLLDEQVSALNFVSELIKSENVPSQVFVSRIPWLLESYSAGDADVVTKRNVAAVIGTIAAMRQDVMPDLLRYIDSFLSWIDQNDDREIRICGMWILGNICKDENVIRDLVLNKGIGSLFGKIIEEECTVNAAASEKDGRIVVAALGALRNFAVPRFSKDPLVESGVLRIVSNAIPVAGKKNLQIMFDGVVLLLSLVRGSPRRARMLVSIPNVLNTIMTVAHGESFAGDDSIVSAVGPSGEKDFRVQYEAGRLAAELCSIPEVIQSLWDLGIKDSLKLLLSSKFDILKNEARTAIAYIRQAGIDVPDDLK